jgi:putative hydrolase of the HAD superfamily
MSEIKNIVFDLGGVIVDIDRPAAIKKFKEIGIANIEEYLDPYRQKGIFHKIEDGSISREDFYEEIFKLTGKRIDTKEIDQGWFDFLLPVELSKLDFILELRKRYKVLLLSNTNSIVMSWARSENFSPARKPLDFYFDEMYLSYELKCMKPELAIFHKMIDLSGINPAETLFIDDSKANIDAGNSLGFRTFWFKPENNFTEINERL